MNLKENKLFEYYNDSISIVTDHVVDKDFFIYSIDRNVYHPWSVNEYIADHAWVKNRIIHNPNLNFCFSNSILKEGKVISYHTNDSIVDDVIDCPVFIYDYSWGNNYQHWLITAVSRLFFYFELKKEIPELKLLHNFESAVFKNELIELLGIDKSEIINHNAMTKYKKIFLPKFDSKSGDYVSDLSIFNYSKLADKLSRTENSSIYPRKIYLSRNDVNGKRPMTNRSELDALLKGKGYVKIILEDLSLENKIILFRNAKYIIGDFSAGWAHCVFCKKGTELILLEHDIFKFSSFYQGISNVLYCDFVSFNSESWIRKIELIFKKIYWKLIKSIDSKANEIEWKVNIKRLNKLL